MIWIFVLCYLAVGIVLLATIKFKGVDSRIEMVQMTVISLVAWPVLILFAIGFSIGVRLGGSDASRCNKSRAVGN